MGRRRFALYAVCAFVLPFLVVGPAAYAAAKPNGKLANARLVAGEQVRLNLRGNTKITFKLERVTRVNEPRCQTGKLESYGPGCLRFETICVVSTDVWQSGTYNVSIRECLFRGLESGEYRLLVYDGRTTRRLFFEL